MAKVEGLSPSRAYSMAPPKGAIARKPELSVKNWEISVSGFGPGSCLRKHFMIICVPNRMDELLCSAELMRAGGAGAFSAISAGNTLLACPRTMPAIDFHVPCLRSNESND